MILYVEGNLFQSPAQVLVNTVNTVGVMGKGIALDFKNLFPEMYQQYREMCEQKKFKIGMLWLYKSPNKWVLNFPTKEHWRKPSQLEYVEKGLQKFVETYMNLGVHSIAFPAVGCGNGQLDFKTQVKPLMEKYLRNLPIEIFIYPGKKSSFVEHLKPEEMQKWLRSEPAALPFVEVWDDLTQLFSKQSNFKTIGQQKPFTAQISQDPLRITITAAGQHVQIPFETIRSFWQQLRTYGFSMRHIVPEIDPRHVSYLIGIFAELDYVTPVHITENYDALQQASFTGLQVLPSAFVRESVPSTQTEQLVMFSM